MKLKESKEQELLSTNANETNNSDVSEKQVREFKEYEELKPIYIVKHDGKWFACLGNFRISELFDKEDEAIQDAKRTDISRIMALMSIMLKLSKRVEELEKMAVNLGEKE